MSHTPGPWIAEDRPPNMKIVFAGATPPRLSPCILLMDDDQEANAHLISAAPDLLAALKEVVLITDRKHDAWDRAHAAIAKAEGRS